MASRSTMKYPGLLYVSLVLLLGAGAMIVTGDTSPTIYSPVSSAVGVTSSRQINTSAPLLGGGNLGGDLSLSISTATTGAAGAQSAADKAKQDRVIDVMDSRYGAKGDNTTDDTTAIQNAATAAIAIGGTLKLPAPSVAYKVTSTINLLPPSGTQFHLNIECEGSTNTIKWAGGNNSSVFYVKGWKGPGFVRHVGIDLGSATGVAAWDLDADGTYQSLSNISFYDCWVSFGAGGRNVGWRGNKSGGNRDLSWLAWHGCFVIGSDRTNGDIGWQALSNNANGWQWFGGGWESIWKGFCGTYQLSTLNGAIDAVVTTIPVNDTTGFMPAGTIKINSEYISYTGISGNSFTGCTRGANSSTPASHTSAQSVFETGPAFAGGAGGTGLTFSGITAIAAAYDFHFDFNGSAEISGGEFEVGRTFIMTGWGGGTFPVTIAAKGFTLRGYAPPDNRLFYLRTVTALTLTCPFITASTPYTSSMIDYAGAGTTTGGSIVVTGGSICAADPCYTAGGNTTWGIDFQQVQRMSDGSTAVGFFASPNGSGFGTGVDGVLNVTSRSVTDAVTNTDTSLTSATAAFVAGDVGANVTGTNIAAGTTIASVTNGTTVVLSQATTGTGTGLSVTIGQIVSVTADKQYSSITVSTGAILLIGADGAETWPLVCCSGTLTNNGTIRTGYCPPVNTTLTVAMGGGAQQASAAAGGNAPASSVTGIFSGSGGGGGTGGGDGTHNGGSSANRLASNGYVYYYFINDTLSTVAGTTGAGANGFGNAKNIPTFNYFDCPPLPGSYGLGGGGGALKVAGGSNVGGAGGKGGRGGGVLNMRIFNLVNNSGANINANAENGSNGSGGVATNAAGDIAGGGGGGAGGGGGTVKILYRTKSGSGTITASGGTGGTKGAGQAFNGAANTGSDGGNGGTGSAGPVVTTRLP